MAQDTCDWRDISWGSHIEFCEGHGWSAGPRGPWLEFADPEGHLLYMELKNPEHGAFKLKDFYIEKTKYYGLGRKKEVRGIHSTLELERLASIGDSACLFRSTLNHLKKNGKVRKTTMHTNVVIAYNSKIYILWSNYIPENRTVYNQFVLNSMDRIRFLGSVPD